MGNFDFLINKAKDVANAAGKVTGEVIETSKLKLQSASLSSDKQKAFEKLGAIVYEAEKTGADCAELVKMCVQEIDELNEKLDDLDGKISEIKQIKKCPNCGSSCPEEAQFCIRCGASLAEQKAQAETPTEE